MTILGGTSKITADHLLPTAGAPARTRARPQSALLH